MTSLVWDDRWGKKTKGSRKVLLLGSELYLGSLQEPIASLDLCSGGSWYRAWIRLPTELRRSAGPLDQMKSVVSHAVMRWLAQAGRDPEELVDGAGI